jgi:4-azaleucine resistance transporter AzlC
MEQWLKEKHHISAYIGLGASLLCLIIFGADSFMIPTMIMIVTLLAVFRKPLEKMGVNEK